MAETVGERPSLRQWYRDTVSCLQSTLATVLIERGVEPLEALGLAWEFRYIPGDVRTEEYYWPCAHPGDLAHSLLPFHDVHSRWRVAPEEDPLGDPASSLAAGGLPILAVDNYHLPFRPAYRDVHAAHLVVLGAIDRDRGVAMVSDAMPPTFQGEIATDELVESWRSPLPPDEQDAFFSGSAVPARWLDVQVNAPFPSLTPERLHSVLQIQCDALTSETDPGPAYTGLAGLRRYLDELAAGAAAGRRGPLVESYTFGWGMQAQAALHGELLRDRGRCWNVPELVEAGRRIEAVAHRWTAVRLTAAHGRHDPAGSAADLRRHGHRLYHAYAEASDTLGIAVDALSASRSS